MVNQTYIEVKAKYTQYAFETYRALSSKYYTHASPTIFNSGGSRQQLASCFLLGVNDSAIGIMDCAKNSALISKNGGGIGIHWHDIRGKGSLIRGTNGDSNGIIPFIKLFNDISRAFNQGGKRKGSFAIYLEMHHCDIIDFLDLRKPQQFTVKCSIIFNHLEKLNVTRTPSSNH